MDMINNKRDAIEFLKDILAMEKIARDDYKKDAVLFSNEKIVTVVKKIKSDEDKHIMLLEGLIEFLSR